MAPNRSYPTILTAALWLLVAPATPQEPTAETYFRKGVSWLHSFEYDEARDQFRRAQRVDPGFAMAYWGEALSYTEPLWYAQDLEAGRTALRRLKAQPRTERERLYIAAVNALYGAGDYRARMLAYEGAMRVLAVRFPGDLDASAFYSLAILGSSVTGRDSRTYMRSAAVAEEVYAKNPQHPGALHYLIHCYDDPVHAPLGLRAARRYAAVAPQAPHALHMPSHIFIAMGMWDDVVSSNEASWNASERRVQERKLGVEDRGYHALYWLHYALLQQGRQTEAARVLGIAQADAARSGLAYVRFHWALMRAHHALETKDWSRLEQPIDMSGVDTAAAAADLFVRAVAAIDRKQTPMVHSLLANLKRLALKSKPAGGHHADHPGPAPDRVALIAAKQVEGLIAVAEKRTGTAITLLREAAALEDATPYEFGPPAPPKPARELLAEVLLATGRAPEARLEFTRALERTPGRARALLGLAGAARQSGDEAAAQAVDQKVQQIRRRADKPPGPIKN